MHCPRCDDKSADIGKRKVQYKKHQKRKIIVAIRVDIIVEQQNKEDNYNSEYTCYYGILQFFQPRFPIHIAICTLHSIESHPKNRQQNNTSPKVGILKHSIHIVERAMLYAKLAIHKQSGPCYKSRKIIEQHIFQYLYFLVHCLLFPVYMFYIYTICMPPI